MVDFEHARHRMVETQIASRGVRDPRVLDAMRKVPREAFVDAHYQAAAYTDRPLPIGGGQTISQPFVVALMAEAARIAPGDRALEVGTGSGYAAAVLGELAAEVVTIERHGDVAELARTRLQNAGYANVAVEVGDGTRGWPQKAPFDAILVTAGAPFVPPSLRSQLRVGGRLVIPVGALPREQRLLRVTRQHSDRFQEEDLGGVLFVPLVGEHGWSEAVAQKL